MDDTEVKVEVKTPKQIEIRISCYNNGMTSYGTDTTKRVVKVAAIKTSLSEEQVKTRIDNHKKVKGAFLRDEPITCPRLVEGCIGKPAYVRNDCPDLGPICNQCWDKQEIVLGSQTVDDKGDNKKFQQDSRHKRRLTFDAELRTTGDMESGQSLHIVML